MKKRTLSIFAFALALNASAQINFGTNENFNKNWKFHLGDEPKIVNDQSITKNWQSVELPHDWSVKGQLSPTLSSCTGFLPGGIGWYSKTFDVDQTKKGEKVYLYFEGVYNRSEVYLNGKLLGARPNGYISFMYDATNEINFDKPNHIVVKVDHSKEYDSRWYTGSGIYRDCWIVYANPIHIAQWGVFAYPTNVDKTKGILNVEVEVENGSAQKATLKVENTLLDKSGKVIAKSSNNVSVEKDSKQQIKLALNVKNPNLWSIDNPNLYTLQTKVYNGKELVDESETVTGFRSITFDPNKGMALNGEWIKAKGVCIHHDAGVLGSAVPKDVWKRRLMGLKEVGVNAIRTSHNPQSSDLYELCDELGLLVMNEAYDEWEFPKRKWMTGWNHGTPGFQGAFDFFKEWGVRDMEDLVRRDRNHPSVFAWSIGNEVDYPNDPYSHPILDGDGGFTQAAFGGYKKDAPDAKRLGIFAKELVAAVKRHDPTRPTTAGLAGVAMSNETEYPGALDICGYNYTESRYGSDHTKYPNRVIYGSENRHDYDAWKSVRDNEHIFGQFLWTGIDYLGESGRWPSRGFYSGLMDFGGFIKPRGYFRQSLWSDTPMIYIGTYPTPRKGERRVSQDVLTQNEDVAQEKNPSIDAWSIWNYNPGQLIRVVCYTNSAKAKLMLNGKEVGATKDRNDENGVIYWDVPYADGNMVAIGMDKEGKEVAQYSIVGSKQPFAIKTTEQSMVVGKDGLAQIVVEVVDENGVKVMLSDNELTCTIDGNATLLGLEGSNNSDMSDYTDNRHRVFNGRMIAYVKLGDNSNSAKVSFSSPWLRPTIVTINR